MATAMVSRSGQLVNDADEAGRGLTSRARTQERQRQARGEQALAERGDREPPIAAAAEHGGPHDGADDQPALVAETDEPEEGAALARRQVRAVREEGRTAGGIGERQERRQRDHHGQGQGRAEEQEPQRPGHELRHDEDPRLQEAISEPSAQHIARDGAHRRRRRAPAPRRTRSCDSSA
jgi:hypothetical protein